MMKWLHILKRAGLIAASAILGLSLAGSLTPVQAARTRIVFWYEMSGPSATEVKKLTREFNHQQSRYVVDPEFEGNYDEAVEKFLNTHGTKTSPALFQSEDISTAQIAKSHYTVPMQKFINRDHYDTSNLSSAALSFYAHKGQQLSMPFNVSQPVMFYDATLFKKYHVKPLPLSPDYHDLSQAALEIYSRSHHRTKGLSITPYGWLFEEFYANANEAFANQHNGHTGLPTRINYYSPVAYKSMEWLQQLDRKGAFINYGSGTNAFTNEIAGFLARKVAMFAESSSDLTQLEQGTSDKVGVTYYPRMNGRPANGVSVGGASLWIGNDKPANVQQGAWEFTKFLLKPNVQAEWEVKTGYLAINRQSANNHQLRHYFAKYPEARVPLEQLLATKPNYNNSGIYMLNMTQQRLVTQGMMTHVYNGASIHQSLHNAMQEMLKSIRQTNRANAGDKAF